MEFHLQHQSSNEYSGMISFKIDWFALLAVQGTLKSLLQHHSSKTSILQCSAFFTVQLSPPYMTTGKTIALTRRTFVGKVISLLFNMLSRLVITFLPRSKHLLISWLQSPSAVVLEPVGNTSVRINCSSYTGMYLVVVISFSFFGHVVWPVGYYFPNQGLNLKPLHQGLTTVLSGKSLNVSLWKA